MKAPAAPRPGRQGTTAVAARAAHADLTDFALGHLPAVIVEQPHLVAHAGRAAGGQALGVIDRVMFICATNLANAWCRLRANQRLYHETEALTLRAGLSHKSPRSEGHGPAMDERIAGFLSKRSKLE